jgi:general nucleoside transport system permease protein
MAVTDTPIQKPTSPLYGRLGPLGQSLAPFVLALVVGALVLTVTGKDALSTYATIFQQAFLGVTNLADTLLFSTPLILTGVATVVAFRAGVFNVGVEGSLYLGAFMAAWVGFTWTGLPGFIVLPLAFILAGLVGALWAWVPAALKAYLQVDEVVTTLMLNYIAIFFTSFLVNGPFLAPGTANSMSPLVSPQAEVPHFMPSSQFNWSFVFAIALTLGLWWMLRRSTLGYAIRMVGDNARFAAASGISVARTIIYSMLLSGMVGGFAGAAQILGVNGRFIDNFSPGYGFQGITVALLAADQPLVIIPAAIFFGALTNGGGLVQLFSNIPIDLINVLQGTVMLFATTRLTLKWFRGRKARVTA